MVAKRSSAAVAAVPGGTGSWRAWIAAPVAALLAACATPAPEPESPDIAAAKPRVSRTSTVPRGATSPAALAQAFVDGMRARDAEALGNLVHPASRAYYRAKRRAEHLSFEEVWRSGNVPAGTAEVEVRDIRSRLAQRGPEAAYRVDNVLFHYPAPPTHNLEIRVRAADGTVLLVANHAIRAEHGRWFIVLPSRTSVERR